VDGRGDYPRHSSGEYGQQRSRDNDFQKGKASITHTPQGATNDPRSTMEIYRRKRVKGES
jgi:hypothetical protein